MAKKNHLFEGLVMPKRTKNMIQQVQQLMDRVAMYGANAKSYRLKASGKFRKVGRGDFQSPGQTDAEFAYMNPDLDNWDWDPDGRVTDDVNRSQAYRKDYACLNDMGADESLDLMLATIEKLRPAGATRAEMDQAWAMFNSAQS